MEPLLAAVAEHLGLAPEEARPALAAALDRLRRDVDAHGRAVLDGVGTFIDDGVSRRFEPDPALLAAVNGAYAGLGPLAEGGGPAAPTAVPFGAPAFGAAIPVVRTGDAPAATAGATPESVEPTPVGSAPDDAFASADSFDADVRSHPVAAPDAERRDAFDAERPFDDPGEDDLDAAIAGVWAPPATPLTPLDPPSGPDAPPSAGEADLAVDGGPGDLAEPHAPLADAEPAYAAFVPPEPADAPPDAPEPAAPALPAPFAATATVGAATIGAAYVSAASLAPPPAAVAPSGVAPEAPRTAPPPAAERSRLEQDEGTPTRTLVLVGTLLALVALAAWLLSRRGDEAPPVADDRPAPAAPLATPAPDSTVSDSLAAADDSLDARADIAEAPVDDAPAGDDYADAGPPADEPRATRPPAPRPAAAAPVTRPPAARTPARPPATPDPAPPPAPARPVPPANTPSPQPGAPPLPTPAASPWGMRGAGGIDLTAGGATWIVASSSAADARMRAERYRALGFRADVITATVNGRRVHRVAVGQFASTADATSARAELPDDAPADAWVLRLGRAP